MNNNQGRGDEKAKNNYLFFGISVSAISIILFITFVFQLLKKI
jgi:hypothetical protein